MAQGFNINEHPQEKYANPMPKASNSLNILRKVCESNAQGSTINARPCTVLAFRPQCREVVAIRPPRGAQLGQYLFAVWECGVSLVHALLWRFALSAARLWRFALLVLRSGFVRQHIVPSSHGAGQC